MPNADKRRQESYFTSFLWMSFMTGPLWCDIVTLCLSYSVEA